MRISEAYPSKYLEGKALGSDVTYTISHVEMEVVGQDDGETKPVVYFNEVKKGLVLNKTNANTIANLYGDDTDVWGGKKITLFPTEVDFQGKQVLAIRVRMRKPPGAGGTDNGEAAAGELAAAKNAAWLAFKAGQPQDKTTQQLADDLRKIIGALFNGRKPEQLGAVEWRKLVEQDFAPAQEAEEVFSGPGIPAEDIPFAPPW